MTEQGRPSERRIGSTVLTNGRSQVLADNEIPYDYAAMFTLTGKSGDRHSEVVNLTADGAFVVVSIGYSVEYAPDVQRDTMSHSRQLSTIAAGALPNPAAYERYLNYCEMRRLCGVDFRYSIIDSGTGRELQNRAIPSLAGLGNMNGDRPFRELARPVLYKPRSTIRIEIEETSDNPFLRDARLYMVFHGYKILGYGAV